MERKTKILLGVFSLILLLIIGGLIYLRSKEQVEEINAGEVEGFKSTLSAFYPDDNRTIGYEFLDNGSVIHIWNNIDDYYFNVSSGIQFTNHYNEYWTKNIFCLGYYNNSEWVKIHCADELSNFNRSIITDNETYVNATLWKDFTYGGYDMRLGVRYHLGLEDRNLSVIIYGRNMDTEDIPFELGFAWRVVDVNIPGLGEDFIEINDSSYSLGDSFNLTFTEMNNSFYNIHDITKFLQLDWNNSLNYSVNMFGNGSQENFSVTLLINAGLFSAGQEKSTILRWIDADTTVENNPSSQTDIRMFCGPYWHNVSVGTLFFPDITTDLSYARTTDGGATWGTTTIASAGTTVNGACWYDGETPGDLGDIIHLVWTDSADDAMYYISVNAENGTIGTQRIVDATVTTSNDPTESRIALTKAVNGELISAVSTQVEIEAYVSVNDGVNWSGIADPYETTTEEDWLLLYPANTGDNKDIAGIFWDRSASQISIKMYDASGNNWTETLIAGGMSAEQNYFTMDASVRHSDGNILLGAHSDGDSLGDDLLTFDISPNSTTNPISTNKTNIFSNQAGSNQVSMFINQQNDDVYLSYIKGGTWLSTMDVVFHNTTDGMGTWSAENNYSETTDDIRIVHGGRTINSDGGRIQWGFYNDDLTEIFVNLVFDIEIPAGVADSPPTVVLSTPANGTSSSTTDYNFTCNVTDDFNIANTTIFVWRDNGTLFSNLTNTSTGTSLNYSFEVPTLDIDGYVWNCEAVDNASQSARATNNFSLTVTSPGVCSPDVGQNCVIDCASFNETTEDVINTNFNISFIGTGNFSILHSIFAKNIFQSKTCSLFINKTSGNLFPGK